MEATITAQIREEIAKTGASLREIQAATGVNYSHLSRWLRGERGLTGEHVDALCRWLGVHLTRSRRKPGPQPKATPPA